MNATTDRSAAPKARKTKAKDLGSSGAEAVVSPASQREAAVAPRKIVRQTIRLGAAPIPEHAPAAAPDKPFAQAPRNLKKTHEVPFIERAETVKPAIVVESVAPIVEAVVPVVEAVFPVVEAVVPVVEAVVPVVEAVVPVVEAVVPVVEAVAPVVEAVAPVVEAAAPAPAPAPKRAPARSRQATPNGASIIETMLFFSGNISRIAVGSAHLLMPIFLTLMAINWSPATQEVFLGGGVAANAGKVLWLLVVNAFLWSVAWIGATKAFAKKDSDRSESV